jgi:hypothetical protein
MTAVIEQLTYQELNGDEPCVNRNDQTGQPGGTIS